MEELLPLVADYAGLIALIVGMVVAFARLGHKMERTHEDMLRILLQTAERSERLIVLAEQSRDRAVEERALIVELGKQSDQLMAAAERAADRDVDEHARLIELASANREALRTLAKSIERLEHRR